MIHRTWLPFRYDLSIVVLFYFAQFQTDRAVFIYHIFPKPLLLLGHLDCQLASLFNIDHEIQILVAFGLQFNVRVLIVIFVIAHGNARHYALQLNRIEVKYSIFTHLVSNCFLQLGSPQG